MKQGIWLSENQFVTFNELTAAQLTNHVASRANSANFWISMLHILPDPDKILNKSGNSVDTYNQMEYDAHIYAEIQKRKALTTSLNLNINRGASSEKYCKLLSDFINSKDHELFSVEKKSSSMDDDASDINDFVEVGLDCLFHGYQPIEIIWDKIGNIFLPVKLIDKPREWFHFDDNNFLRFKSKASPYHGELLPDKKFIVFRNKPRYNNPYGTRILSRCFWPWTFKHSSEKWKIQFLEKFATVWAIGKLPRGKENPEYVALLDSLDEMINSGVAVIPDDGSVELKEPAGKGSTADMFSNNVKEYNAEISKAIMTVTLLTEVGSSGGNRALGTVMERVAGKVASSDKREPEKRITQLFRWMFDVNGWGTAPTAELLEPEDYDIERAERDGKLKEQGVRLTKKYYQDKFNLKEDEFEMEIAKDTTNENITLAEASEKIINRYAEPVQKDPVKIVLDSLSDKQLQTAINPIVNDVLKAFKESADFAEAMEKILTIVPAANTNSIEELIVKLNTLTFAQGASEIK